MKVKCAECGHEAEISSGTWKCPCLVKDIDCECEALNERDDSVQ